MDLKLSISVWFIAPISGAVSRYITSKRVMPAVSIIQAAAVKMFRNKYVAVAARADAKNIFAEFCSSALVP